MHRKTNHVIGQKVEFSSYLFACFNYLKCFENKTERDILSGLDAPLFLNEKGNGVDTIWPILLQT